MNLEQLRARREEILATARRHGARTLRVFGSVARGDADAESDIDFLVELEPGRSLLDQGALLMDLQERLGCRVDVMTEAGLRPSVRARAAGGVGLVRDDRTRLNDMLEDMVRASHSLGAVWDLGRMLASHAVKAPSAA
jgi:uncharacterized protein